ncbi:MAG TPA: SGNH/GDSL hydrolase family protein [Thermoanaerobaculia bacterium]|nr:SGNH/GDSL hydrolase family protein [Thermoanaerobaculia bacterium]
MLNQRTIRRLAIAVAVAALAVSPALGQGADFTRYVALGDSLTAAFMSGGLINEVQRNSYPALINTQAGGRADFQQPLVGTPGIPPLLDLVSLRPLIIAPKSSTNGLPQNLGLQRPYDNLAVPGFRVRDVLNNPTGNGLVDLILRPPGFGNASALQQALLLRPTFVTLWIGNNDVLGAATSGIVIEGVTLTPVAQFEQQLRSIVSPIRAAGANLAIANIPNVTVIPFVTTIPPVVVNPTTNMPVLVNGQPVPLLGPNGPLALTDRVLLTASGPLSRGIGIPLGIPGGTGMALSTQFVLDGNELAMLSSRVAAYNDVIRRVASEAGAALVDMNGAFNEIAAEGLEIAGIEFSSAFLTGGIFSYDGVHPTPFGYAFTANEFIAAINERFGNEIEPVDLFRFTFGSDGSAGTFTGSVLVKDLVFSEAAYENLRRSLRTPSTERLLEILRQRGQDEGPTGGPGPTGDRPEPPAKRPQRDRPNADG